MRLTARFTTAELVTRELVRLVICGLVTRFTMASFCLLQCACANTILAASPNVESKAVPNNHLRRPVAMVLTDDCLYVANRQSGTITRIDVHSHTVLDEQRIGTQLSDLRRFGDDCLLATDEATNELLLVRESDGQLDVSKRIAVATTPVSLLIDQRNRVSIASLWARRMTILDGNKNFAVESIIDLPFAPRVQCLLPGDRLAVADSFGGKLAVIDLQHGKLLSLRSLNAHNIRGLSISNDGKQLLITHQQLINQVPTTQNRVSWGQVVSNLMHTVDIERLIPDDRDSGELNPVEQDPIAWDSLVQDSCAAATRAESGDESMPVVPIVKWFLEPLGEHKNAAGDPGQLLLTSSGQRIVCLSGVNEIGIADNDTAAYTRLSVGRRPVTLACDERSSLVYAANMYDDSVSVIDTRAKQVERTISLGKTRELSWIEMGEQFFYDARLSFDGWYSCHSCHPDGHTTSLTNDNLGDETYQTPKLVLSLLGTEDTRPWAWDGHQVWLREQVSASMKTTMRNNKGDAEIYSDAVGALTDFVRTLKAPPALRVARGQSLQTNKIKQGRELFATYGCSECHSDNVYTSEVIVDIGLQDEAGERQFNPPSLRGVSQRDAWLHDGRATRLRDVFEKVGHPNAMTAEMSCEEVDALVEFLQTL